MKRLVHLQWLCSIHVRTYFHECLFSLQREALSGHQSRSETWPYLGEDIKTKLKSCHPTSFYCWYSFFILSMKLFFFLIATWLLNFSKWYPIQKKFVAIFKDSALDRPSKIWSRKRSLTCYKVDTRMDDIQCSSSPKPKIVSSYWSRCMYYVLDIKLNKEVCRGFIFANLFNSSLIISR